MTNLYRDKVMPVPGLSTAELARMGHDILSILQPEALERPQPDPPPDIGTAAGTSGSKTTRQKRAQTAGSIRWAQMELPIHSRVLIWCTILPTWRAFRSRGYDDEESL